MARSDDSGKSYVRPFQTLTKDDGAVVGGKNASLGEMIQHLGERGIAVPGGFATTADAYRDFLAHNQLEPKLRQQLDKLSADGDNLKQVGRTIRSLFSKGEMPEAIAGAIRRAYRELSERFGKQDVKVAARSSATAEDLPSASFAGQLETYLNVQGEDALLEACKRCFASAFTDRGISYRQEHGFDHMQVAVSVGVQRMARADLPGGSAGVMFTLDPETGFRDVIVINSNWGLGETVVSGTVDPDELRVFKPLLEKQGVRPVIRRRRGAKARKIVFGKSADEPTQTVDTSDQERQGLSLSEDDALTLARWAKTIEEHYDRPMDIEWARDGETGELSIVQARPETVQSQKVAGVLETFKLTEQGDPIVQGVAVGGRIAAGRAFVLKSPKQGEKLEDGGVLVTSMTNPDWGPLLKRAGAVVTDHGGRTSHAAIVSRELGLPAVLGTGDATKTIEDGQEVTVSCAAGDVGVVYDGVLDFERRELSPGDLPETRTPILQILASPAAALQWWQLPTRGVGLARLEFVINSAIRIHPLALTRFDDVKDKQDRKRIEQLTAGYEDKPSYFVDKLSRAVAEIAAGCYPHPAIVRLSDFKTNEYAQLIGGGAFEPEEANPMLGFRGAARYVSEDYADGFALECQAIRQARETLGLDNVVVMIPFCRTIDEADRVLAAMAEHGLVRGKDGLKVYVMAEIPANVVLAEQFAQRFDGFSIGTNDLTQLVLGADRDSAKLRHLFDARNDAVKAMIAELIRKAHDAGATVGICGQAPSDHPAFAAFLVEQGIDTISVNPDSVLDVIEQVSRAERGV